MAKSRARGSCLGCAVQAAALSWLALLAGGGAVILALADLPHSQEQWVGVGVLTAWAASVLFLLPLVMGLVVMRRNRRLDDAFAPLGVDGMRMGAVSRGWAGRYRGREFNAWFSRGPMLEIFLAAESGGRMVEGLGKRPTGDPWVIDGIAREPEASRASGRLLEEDGRTLRNLTVGPDYVKLTLRYLPIRAIEDAAVASWVADLNRIAEAVDALPLPADPAVASNIENLSRRERRTLHRRVSCVLYVFSGFFLVIAIVLSAAFAFAMI